MSKLNMSCKDEILYITSMLSKSKSTSPWTCSEKVLSNIILGHISEYRVFLSKVDRSKIESLDSDVLQKEIKKIPLHITLTRKNFLDITKLNLTNAAREIKKPV